MGAKNKNQSEKGYVLVVEDSPGKWRILSDCSHPRKYDAVKHFRNECGVLMDGNRWRVVTPYSAKLLNARSIDEA